MHGIKISNLYLYEDGCSDYWMVAQTTTVRRSWYVGERCGFRVYKFKRGTMRVGRNLRQAYNRFMEEAHGSKPVHSITHNWSR